MRPIKGKASLLLILNLLFCATYANAQTWEEIVKDKEKYIYGIGSGSNLEEAKQAALADLNGKISISVASSFEQIEDEKTKNGELDASSYIRSKVSSYSSATLTNTEQLDKPDGDEWLSLRYIERSEVNKIFEGRKTKVTELVKWGETAESQYKVGDALKYYYWAFTLLKTLQYPNQVTYTDTNGAEQILSTYLPYKINNIFDDIRATVTKRDGEIAELYFTFRGHPAVNMDFTYFNGRQQSNVYNVKDGRGDMDLPSDYNPEYLSLTVEYTYHQDAKTCSPEVRDVQDVVKKHTLPKANLKIPMGKTFSSVNEKPVISTAYPENGISSGTKSALVELDDDSYYSQKADAFVDAIRTKNYHRIDGLFTQEGLELYNQLLNYGTPRIYGEPDYKVFRKDDEVVVRSIPMSFSFKHGARKSIVEDVVLSFDTDGKIHWLSFALDEPAVNDILSKGLWSDTVRRTILSFLEDYKTAYCLERIDYLNQVFSDDAIIIVGHVLQVMTRTNDKDKLAYANNKVITKTKYNKDEYIKHLNACFHRNECINIHFANNDITKAGKGDDTYGIQIKQDYYSTTYGDSGYLFLLVDFNNPEKPTILVRAWQEEPDPNFGLINLNHFQ